MVAINPLSQYLNGWVGSPAKPREICCATCSPDCIATEPSCGRTFPSEATSPISPTTKISGCSGTLKSGFSLMRPPRPCGNPRISASGFAFTPAAQISVCALISSPDLRRTKVGPTSLTASPKRTSTRRSSGQDQVVISYLVPILQFDFVRWYVHARHRRHAKGHVLLVPKQAAHRRSDILCVQQRCRYLIKQRLEGVVVVPID